LVRTERRAEAALRFIAASREFALSEVPGLRDADRHALVSALVDWGVLHVVNPN
jgi:hypothetical protein